MAVRPFERARIVHGNWESACERILGIILTVGPIHFAGHFMGEKSEVSPEE
jgi:hypothetical protein